MLKSLKARLQQIEARTRREEVDALPPLEFVDRHDFCSEEAFEARVAEITSRYPPDYAGIKVVIVERSTPGGSDEEQREATT